MHKIRANEWHDRLLSRALGKGALRFGDFELKSRRRSPYFFDAGRLLDDAQSLVELGRAYADAIVRKAINFDVLFGPAYKGIPLAAATSFALLSDHDVDCGVAYNRKEAKEHGEGGRAVGASLAGRVFVIDDVITAGTAVREVLPLIKEAGGTVVGVMTLLDRQERGQGERSACQELAEDMGAQVHSILTLDDLLVWLGSSGQDKERELIADYRRRYGVAA